MISKLLQIFGSHLVEVGGTNSDNMLLYISGLPFGRQNKIRERWTNFLNRKFNITNFVAVAGLYLLSINYNFYLVHCHTGQHQ